MEYRDKIRREMNLLEVVLASFTHVLLWIVGSVESNSATEDQIRTFFVFSPPGFHLGHYATREDDELQCSDGRETRIRENPRYSTRHNLSPALTRSPGFT